MITIPEAIITVNVNWKKVKARIVRIFSYTSVVSGYLQEKSIFDDIAIEGQR